MVGVHEEVGTDLARESMRGTLLKAGGKLGRGVLATVTIIRAIQLESTLQYVLRYRSVSKLKPKWEKGNVVRTAVCEVLGPRHCRSLRRAHPLGHGHKTPSRWIHGVGLSIAAT